jgi:hypothetical protein
MKTKEEILNKHDTSRKYIGQTCRPELFAAMDEYAKQQAIAFVKYNCPDIKLEDSLLNAGYAGFLIHQCQNK